MQSIKRNEFHEMLVLTHDYNINPVTREIYLGGWPRSYDDEEVGVDHQMATELIRNMTFLNGQSSDPIMIHQCTVGGEWEYGMAIYNAISSSPCHVVMIGYAHARSMSSIMIQAADHRVLMPDCMFMVHHGTITCIDTYTGAQSYMEQAKGDARRMMEVYIDRGCKMTEKQILDKLDKKQEWYMSAEEAVELGFADEVFDGDWARLRAMGR